MNGTDAGSLSGVAKRSLLGGGDFSPGRKLRRSFECDLFAMLFSLGEANSPGRGAPGGGGRRLFEGTQPGEEMGKGGLDRVPGKGRIVLGVDVLRDLISEGSVRYIGGVAGFIDTTGGCLEGIPGNTTESGSTLPRLRPLELYGIDDSTDHAPVRSRVGFSGGEGQTDGAFVDDGIWRRAGSLRLFPARHPASDGVRPGREADFAGRASLQGSDGRCEPLRIGGFAQGAGLLADSKHGNHRPGKGVGETKSGGVNHPPRTQGDHLKLNVNPGRSSGESVFLRGNTGGRSASTIWNGNRRGKEGARGASGKLKGIEALSGYSLERIGNDRVGSTQRTSRSLSETILTQITEGVVDEVKAIYVGGKDFGQVRLRLFPPELGEVRVRLELEGKKVKTFFVVENHKVKSIVDSGAGRLAEAFNLEGFVLEDFGVSVGGHGGRAGEEDLEEGVLPAEPGVRNEVRGRVRAGRLRREGIDVLV